MPANTLYIKYYDYDMDFPIESSSYKIDRIYGAFHVYESGDDLIIELIHHTPDDLANFKEAVENEAKHGYTSAEYEIFETIRVNGMDYITADQIGALSEAPIFAEFAYIPDWISRVKHEAARIRHSWTHSAIPFSMIEPTLCDYWSVDWDHSRMWTFDRYQIESPLDVIAETGRVTFTRVKE